MSTHGELEISRNQAVQSAAPIEQVSLESLVVTMAQDPAMTTQKVEVIERLMAMMERRDAQGRKEKFFEALARVQAVAPRIQKNGLMDRGTGKGQISYAKREDIDAVMRPIYQKEGFSVTWDAPMTENRIQIIGRFTAFGHTEQREWSCLPDSSGGKQNPQAAGSTVSYGKRYISEMFWDVIEEGADTNGSKREDVEPISQDQADDIRTRMNDLPQARPGILLSKLCQKYGVEQPEEIKVSQLTAALADVAATERQKAAR